MFRHTVQAYVSVLLTSLCLCLSRVCLAEGIMRISRICVSVLLTSLCLCLSRVCLAEGIMRISRICVSVLLTSLCLCLSRVCLAEGIMRISRICLPPTLRSYCVCETFVNRLQKSGLSIIPWNYRRYRQCVNTAICAVLRKDKAVCYNWNNVFLLE